MSKKETKFNNIGIQGRRTGITLPTDIKKDEFGFDDLDMAFEQVTQPNTQVQEKKKEVKEQEGEGSSRLILSDDDSIIGRAMFEAGLKEKELIYLKQDSGIKNSILDKEKVKIMDKSLIKDSPIKQIKNTLIKQIKNDPMKQMKDGLIKPTLKSPLNKKGSNRKATPTKKVITNEDQDEGNNKDKVDDKVKVIITPKVLRHSPRFIKSHQPLPTSPIFDPKHNQSQPDIKPKRTLNQRKPIKIIEHNSFHEETPVIKNKVGKVIAVAKKGNKKEISNNGIGDIKGKDKTKGKNKREVPSIKAFFSDLEEDITFDEMTPVKNKNQLDDDSSFFTPIKSNKLVSISRINSNIDKMDLLDDDGFMDEMYSLGDEGEGLGDKAKISIVKTKMSQLKKKGRTKPNDNEVNDEVMDRDRNLSISKNKLVKKVKQNEDVEGNVIDEMNTDTKSKVVKKGKGKVNNKEVEDDVILEADTFTTNNKAEKKGRAKFNTKKTWDDDTLAEGKKGNSSSNKGEVGYQLGDEMMNQLDNSINKKVRPILTEINAYKARTIKDMEVKPTKKRTKPQSINSEEDGEDDDNGLTRRSSRKRFKPLKFWKNERLEHEVETLPDGQIQKVLKVKKITNSNSPKIKMKSNLKKSKAIANKVEQYNQLCQLYQPNQPTSNDFTFPYTSISTTSPDDITETYSINIQYNQPSDLLTGTIDLFPYQTKPIRSTQSSKFVYQIQFGRCMFEINDQTFMVGMGGSIIIDKDKSYNITNPDKWIARLGFVQIAK